MKLLFLTDNFPPEVNAPATRTFEHCKLWVKHGVNVTVITCSPNFPHGVPYKGYKNKILQKENIEGIKVYRVWSFMAPNKGIFLRLLDFNSYAFMSFIVGLFIPTDIIMATSPQFFTAMSGKFLSFWKRKPFILEIRDLWPDQILAATTIKRNILMKYFEYLEKKCYKSAHLIVTVTDSYVSKIMSKAKVTKEKFIVITNGVDNLAIGNNENKQVLTEKYGLKNKKVVGYIGTHGASQNLPFIIHCIAEFNNAKSSQNAHNNVVFMFVGDGAEKSKIIKLATDYNLENVIFENQIPKENMPYYLSLLDISLVPLRKSPLYLSVIPSKIFEVASMNIPILLGVDGEARGIIERYNCGIYFEPENKTSFITQMTKLIETDISTRLKEGCKALSEDYKRENLAMKLLNKIKTVHDENNRTHSR